MAKKTKTPKHEKILSYLKRRKTPATVADLANAASTTKGAVYVYLNRLRKDHQIDTVRNGRTAGYQLTSG